MNNQNKKSAKLLWLIPVAILIIALVMIVFVISGNQAEKKEMGSRAGDASVGGFIDYVFSGDASTVKKSSNSYEPLTNKKKQTFMVYLVGSDLESDSAAASLDLTELQEANIDAQNCNFVIFTGGSTQWHLDIPADKNSIIYLSDDGLYRLQDKERSNMGDPSTLAFFLEYSYYSFPAEEYHLILWNHGGGSIVGYGQDMLSNKDSLLLKEIKSALEASPFDENNKINSIIFDACLMATVETANIFKDYAEYLIASEEITSGYGFYYDSFAEIVENNATGAELAQILCSESIDYLYFLDEEYGTNTALDAQKTPFSCMDLSKVEDLEKAMDDFFSALDKDISKSFSKISRARDAVYTYATYASPNNASIDHIDLVEFAEHFLDDYPEEAQALIDAVNEMVEWELTQTDYSHGISFYFPYYGLSAIDYKLDIYSDFDFSKGYTRFMSNFVKMLQGEEPTVWEDSEEQFGTDEEDEEETAAEEKTTQAPQESSSEVATEPVTEKETEPSTEKETEPESSEEATKPQQPENSKTVSEISLTLNDAQVKNFLKAERCIYIKNHQGGYYLVSRTSDVDVNGNTLTAQAVDYQYVLTDGEHEIELSMTEFRRTEDEIIYSAPVKLCITGARNSTDVMLEGVYAYLSIVFNDEYPEGKILGYYRLKDKNYETLCQLEEGMTMMSISLGIMEKEKDEYGNLKPIYASDNTTEFVSEEVIEVNDNLEIIKKPFDGQNNVYMSVVIYDTHNYRFSTSYRKIKAKTMG